MKRILTVILMFVLTLVTGCNNNTQEASNLDKLVITTTTGQIADIVQNIGGENVVITSLMGPGVDPHLYQASQGDISKLSNADMIFYNGLHLEGKMGELFEKLSTNKTIIAVGENVPKEKLLIDKANSKSHDPHIWFDPELWAYAVEAVRDGLIEADEKNSETYKKNAEIYLKELKELKVYAQERFTEIPEESRVLVTAHDAFKYLGKAYNFEVKGLQGLSTDSEYGLRDVQDLVDLLVDRKIKAVFIESSISEKSIQAVVEGAKQKGHNVSIGGELYSDAMGDRGTVEGTYIGMYKHNIDTIVSALK